MFSMAAPTAHSYYQAESQDHAFLLMAQHSSFRCIGRVVNHWYQLNERFRRKTFGENISRKKTLVVLSAVE